MDDERETPIEESATGHPSDLKSARVLAAVLGSAFLAFAGFQAYLLTDSRGGGVGVLSASLMLAFLGGCFAWRGDRPQVRRAVIEALGFGGAFAVLALVGFGCLGFSVLALVLGLFLVAPGAFAVGALVGLGHAAWTRDDADEVRA